MKTQTYTKINTLYKRYQNLGKVDLPNKDWRVFQNKIILGDYSDDYMGYIKGLKFDCFSKICKLFSHSAMEALTPEA